MIEKRDGNYYVRDLCSTLEIRHGEPIAIISVVMMRTASGRMK